MFRPLPTLRSVRAPLRAALAALAWLLAACAAPATLTVPWTSPATGRELALEFDPPPTTSAPAPLVIYLRGLAAPRAGTEADESILRDLRAAGLSVAILDYHGDPRARWPHLNTDFADLRRQLYKQTLRPPYPLDPAQIYLVPAGHRLRRGVPFHRDGDRVLRLDVLYPSGPAAPVGAILEFSCDNENRMGNYSLQFCSDTLLEGAATEGFAVAMADHPVAAPYAGFDPLPDAAFKVKSAVRTLRAQAADLPLNGRIVALGFSRGSGMALLAAATPGRSDLESGGEHRVVDSTVQGAVVLSGRFTYLDLLADDAMLPRYRTRWGDRDAAAATWRDQGALDHVRAPTVPLFLSINATESRDALHQMQVLRERLAAARSPFVFHEETTPRGHRMPLAPAVLDPLLLYLRDRLR